jgi:hypothetical protein
MIGASQTLTPAKSSYRPNPVSAMAGISPLRTLSAKTTESAKHNAYASGMEKGNTEAQGYLDQQMGRGTSQSAKDEMFAEQRRAAGQQEGAMDAASVESADQMFNSNQRFGQRQMQLERMNNNYRRQTDLQNSNFQNQFTLDQTRKNNYMDARGKRQSLWLSLLGQLG